MISRFFIIFSFLLATLLAAGAVELFYNALGKAMLEDKEVLQTKTKKIPGPNFSSPASVATGQKRSNKRKEDYSIISKRNLFGKVQKTTNKPVTKPQPVLTTTSLDLTLLGTIGGKDNDQRAIIRDKKKNTQDIYYKGDAIANALIKEISRGKIILTLNGKDEVLLMEEAKSPPGNGKRQDFTMPRVIKPPARPVNDDTLETEGDEASDIPSPDSQSSDDDIETDSDLPFEEIPSPATPKRIMDITTKKGHR